ncbi:MAG: asparagine synthase (glutamine-hydrolyzing) [Dehalococcoidia bacterium]
MCGIAGIYNRNGEPVEAEVLKRMTASMAHRGPDGEGCYTTGPVGLGHRRLAIIDLSPAGQQPMGNETGEVTITYSGEVYNYQELRKELEAKGHRFRSRTDTEVVVHAFEEWGEACVHRFNGMFAFAIWDSTKNRLFLARDRYGIKPLYYYDANGLFLFASEIKGLLEHPEVKARVCYEALGEYFTFQNIFNDKTLFDGVRLLPPGSTLTIEAGREARVQQNRYWDYSFRDGIQDMSLDECSDEVYRLFDQAVTRQLVADVPVGSYLSGGMDSGSITSVAARHIPRIHTFTGGFDLSSASGLELAFDERPASELMANLFKSEHYEVVMHAGDMEHILPTLIWHLEDLRVGQCYPNYYVARLASKFVKVVLSGGGGDELFAGYPWRYYRGLTSNGPDGYYQAYYNYWQRLVQDEDRARFYNDDTYTRVRAYEPFDSFRNVFAEASVPMDSLEDMVNASLYFEIKTFLHGLLLVEDKLSMAHSLETRVPFLDNDLVDFAMRVPARYKLRDLERAPYVDEDEPGKVKRYQSHPTSDGKVVLRNAMSRLIPQDVTNRAKQGFSAPDASWFRGESIDYINGLLRDPKARIYEHIRLPYVENVLDQHTAGKVNHRLLIWSLMSFEWWLRVFVK